MYRPQSLLLWVISFGCYRSKVLVAVLKISNNDDISFFLSFSRLKKDSSHKFPDYAGQSFRDLHIDFYFGESWGL